MTVKLLADLMTALLVHLVKYLPIKRLQFNQGSDKNIFRQPNII